MQASPPAGPVLADSDPGNSRVLFVILFWFALATSVELWWLDTPARSVTSWATHPSASTLRSKSLARSRPSGVR